MNERPTPPDLFESEKRWETADLFEEEERQTPKGSGTSPTPEPEQTPPRSAAVRMSVLVKVGLGFVLVALLWFLYWFGGIVAEELKGLIELVGGTRGSKLGMAVVMLGYFFGFFLFAWLGETRSKSRVARAIAGFWMVTMFFYMLPLLALLVRAIFSSEWPACDVGIGRYCE